MTATSLATFLHFLVPGLRNFCGLDSAVFLNAVQMSCSACHSFGPLLWSREFWDYLRLSSLHFKNCRWLLFLQDAVCFLYILPFLHCCSFFFFLFLAALVFIAARGLSLVAVSEGCSSLRCAGFSLQWLLLLQSTGSRCAGFSSCGTRA